MMLAQMVQGGTTTTRVRSIFPFEKASLGVSKLEREE